MQMPTAIIGMLKHPLNGHMLKSDHFIGGLIFIVCFLIFLVSPVHQLSDSQYSILLSESLLKHGSFALDGYAIPRLAPVARTRDDYVMNGDIYQLEVANNHLYYYFPPGSSVLSIPYVALMNGLGISAANRDGTYNPEGEEEIETSLAALLMAALATIFFYMSRLVLPTGWSVLIALGGTLGTQIWSTASRALWSHTWEVLLAGLVVLMLLTHETGRHKIKPVLLASLLSWMYCVRPNSAVMIVILSAYIFLYHAQIFTRYALTGAAWLAGLVVYSWSNFGKALPSYFLASRLTFRVFPTALAGNLISPSRGLFIYVPTLLFLIYLLVRLRKYLAPLRLVWLSLIIITAYLAVISGFSNWWGDWWGGASYGPRYTTDLVPWFVLLSILGVKAMLRWRQEQRAAISLRTWGAPLATGGLLLSLSLFINAWGAISVETWNWTRPATDQQMRALLWDWSNPQFLAGLLPPEFPLIRPETHIDFTTREAEPYLWYGWSSAEPQFRWTDGRKAAIIFALDEVTDLALEIKLGPFLAPGRLDEQHLEVSLNGRLVERLVLRESAAAIYRLSLPKQMLRRENVLGLRMDDAASPRLMGVSEDGRRLGVRVEWIDLKRQGGK